MTLGIISLPAGVYSAAANVAKDSQGRTIWREGDAPIPVAALEEIGVTATRDYLPAVIAGLVLLYALTRGNR